MRKLYLLVVLSMLAANLFSQIRISFEASEGFELGNIHEQNDWEVTEGIDGILTNQVISDAMASDGAFAFKNSHEPGYDFQWMPIFGAAKVFDTPIDYTDFTISYDVLVTENMGADFEFVAYTIIDEEFVPVAGVGMEYQGEMYIIKDEDYDYHTIEATWEPNTWVHVEVKVNQEEVKYYVDEELQYTLDNFSQSDIHGINMLHNNYGGDAYYDNIHINSESLGVEDQEFDKIKLYPNPTTDFVTFQLGAHQNIKDVEVYNITGKKISVQRTEKVDLRAFPAGTYILKATLENNQNLIRKVLKK